MNRKPRLIKELLILVRDNINLIENRGICYVVSQLWYQNTITITEQKLLETFLNKNLPKKRYPLFDYAVALGNAYCWIPGVTQGRINWLNKQIDLL